MRVFKTCFVACAALGAVYAPAAIAYNNFGPGSGGFEFGGGGYIIGKYSLNSVTLQQGFQFTAGASGSISGIYVGLDFAESPENGAGAVPTFDIYADSGSNTLGALMSTWTGVTPVGTAVQALAGGSGTLVSGSKYWLVAREPDPTRMYGWSMNNQGAMGNKTISFDGGSSFSYDTDLQTEGAFRIDVDPQSVPEPFTMALMGGAALAGYRRVRRKAA